MRPTAQAVAGVRPTAEQRWRRWRSCRYSREVQRQIGQGGQARRRACAAIASCVGSTDRRRSAAALGDILGQLKDKLGKLAAQAVRRRCGGIADILGQILGQATAGAKEGATRIGEATGAKDALGRATGGQSPEELLEKLKGLVRDNPMAATGAAGGLGGLVLGTKTGRAVAGSAVRIGALALIGGLAYKAFQNYQAGKPLITGFDRPKPRHKALALNRRPSPTKPRRFTSAP